MSTNTLNIVAAGGGAPNKSSFEFMRHGLDLAGKDGRSNVLIIPTAKRTVAAHESAINAATDAFGTLLSQDVEILHGFESVPDGSELEEKLATADLVYISGGDTDHMMETWKAHGIDRMLARRALSGLVLTGVSAGAIAPFSWGHSDSLSYRVPKDTAWDYIPVDGLGLVTAAITPHFDTSLDGVRRSDRFAEMFMAQQADRPTAIGFGIDNGAAVVVRGGEISTLSAQDTSGVTLLEMSDGRMKKTRLTNTDTVQLP